MTHFTRNHNVIFVVYIISLITVVALGARFDDIVAYVAAVIAGWLGGWTANDLYRYQLSLPKS